MGERNRRRRFFFEQHPVCCFCGGRTQATTVDHSPSRSIFFERRWPEGYAFPACENCNSATRLDELLVAMLSRVNSGASTPAHEDAEIAKYLADVANNFPGLLEAMRPTAEQLRKARDKYGVQTRVLSLSDERIHNAVEKLRQKARSCVVLQACGADHPEDWGCSRALVLERTDQRGRNTA